MKNKTIKILLIFLIMGLFWVLNGGKVYAEFNVGLAQALSQYGIPYNIKCGKKDCTKDIEATQFFVTEPTCTEPLKIVVNYFCSKLYPNSTTLHGATQVTYTYENTVLGHAFPKSTSDCDDKCSRCGTPRYDQHIPRTTGTVSPTCTENGYTRVRCSRDGCRILL